MVLALRIYGDFQWTPSPKSPTASELSEPRRKCVIEIHYQERAEDDGKFWPVLHTFAAISRSWESLSPEINNRQQLLTDWGNVVLK
jgi:hypothetical protein